MRPSDIPGWMTDAELHGLAGLSNNKTVLEIGTWMGRSASMMCLAGATVWCLDTFRGDQFTGPAWTLPNFLNNMEQVGVSDKVRILVGPWQEILPTLSLTRFDLLFFDADHTYESTYNAGMILSANMRDDAVLAFHDYNWPEVHRAVDDIIELSGRSLYQIDTIAVLTCQLSAA